MAANAHAAAAAADRPLRQDDRGGIESPAFRAQLLAAEAELARLEAGQQLRPIGRLVRPEPRIITERFLAKVD